MDTVIKAWGFVGGLNLVLIGSSHAEVVFDGTIGSNPAGTFASGDFFILESEGEVRGNNLFHSFDRFNVQTGESASFVHTGIGIENIIARVSGNTATTIQGTLETIYFDGADLFFTDAALWLINPNGIVIGEGAEINAAGPVNFSTANRIGFENGDDFYSHELSISSTLSIAAPTTFGFLDKQGLPSTVTPRGISVLFDDPINANSGAFLGDTYLVGTSTDPDVPGISIQGDIDGVFRDDFAAILDASVVEFLNLGAFALGVGEDGAGSSVNLFDLSTFPTGLGASDIFIEDISLSVVSRFADGETALQLYGSNLVLSNSAIRTFSVAQTVSTSLFASNGAIGLFDTELVSTNTDISAGNGGDINVDGLALLLLNSDLRTSDSTFTGATGPVGNSGGINIGTNSNLFSANIEDGSRIATLSNFSSASSGDIVIQADNLSVGGGDNDINIASVSNGIGAGDVTLDIQSDLIVSGTADSIVTVSTQGLEGAAPGDISIRANLVDTNFLDVFSAGLRNTDARPLIEISGGGDGILMTNGSITNASSVSQEFSGADISIRSDGDLSIASARGRFNIESIAFGDNDAGSITLEARDSLLLFGGVVISNRTSGSSDSTGQAEGVRLSATNITIDGTSGVVDEEGFVAVLTSSTTTAGDSSGIVIEASEQLLVDGQVGILSQTGGIGNAGSIELSGRDVFVVNENENNSAFISALTNGDGDGSPIRIEAQEQLTLSGNVLVDNSALASGNAGSVTLTSDNILLEGDSLGVSTSSNALATGDAGIIEFTALNTLALDSILGVFSEADVTGNAGFIRMSAENIIVIDSQISNTVTADIVANQAGAISLSAGDSLLLNESLLVSSAAGTFATAGSINLSAEQNFTIEETDIQSGSSEQAISGDINISAGNQLFMDGDGTNILTNAEDDSNGGNINVSADSFLMLGDALLQVAADRGQSGNITVQGRDIQIFRKGLDAFSSGGGGGNVTVLASERLTLNPGGAIFALSESSTADGDGGSVQLGSIDAPIPLLLIRGGLVTANANAGNGGQINIFADNFLRDSSSTLSVSSTSGAAGALEISAPERDISAAVNELNVGLLDATDLIRSACETTQQGAATSSLALIGSGGLTEPPDSYSSSNYTSVRQAEESADTLAALDWKQLIRPVSCNGY
ncbi:MAG: filamentous hemagglutinin N-terminal domain-containing protein [Pseudomonadales bacterium]